MEARISLMELLQEIHDPRGAKGKRHPLTALLALAIGGMTRSRALVESGQERRSWRIACRAGLRDVRIRAGCADKCSR